MAMDLFGGAGSQPLAKPLTVFRAELLSRDQVTWEELFDGYTALKAVTFSSSLEFLLRLADRLDDIEVVFGSESILSKEHLALAQASQTIQAYGFGDALVDQKALVEALAQLLGHAGRALVERVAGGSLRFRLLRDRPSHEKLYLLAGPAGSRVVTGSANLSLAAFEGRQHEVYVASDGSPAWALFDSYCQRDWKDSLPVEPNALIARGEAGAIAARDTPLALEEVPIVRALNDGLALVDGAPGRRRPASPRTPCGMQPRVTQQLQPDWPNLEAANRLVRTHHDELDGRAICGSVPPRRRSPEVPRCRHVVASEFGRRRAATSRRPTVSIRGS